MIRVALKGIAGRKLRTILTALAIVLGVSMVAGAYTLTDTMKGAADSLSASAYDSTDAVVSAKTAFGAGDNSAVQRPVVPASAVEQVRSIPGVGVAVGDITDEARILDKSGDVVGSGPYFGGGYDARAPGAAKLSPFKITDGRFATAANEVAVDAGTAKKHGYPHRRHRPDHHQRAQAALPRGRHRHVRRREVARHRHHRSVRPARGAGPVRQARRL